MINLVYGCAKKSSEAINQKCIALDFQTPISLFFTSVEERDG